MAGEGRGAARAHPCARRSRGSRGASPRPARAPSRLGQGLLMSTGRVATTVTKLGASNVPKTTLGRGSPPAPIQQSNDRQQNDLQRQLAQAVQAAKSHPHANGLYVARAQSFTAGGTVTIAHGLGRAFV